MNKRALGAGAEGLACDYIIGNGAVVLEKNYRTKGGEIDIIAKDGKYVCFIEVKYRQDESFGNAIEAVNRQKQIKICRVSKFYLYSKYNSFDLPVRYDVIAISQIDKIITVNWIKNAFDFVER